MQGSKILSVCLTSIFLISCSNKTKLTEAQQLEHIKAIEAKHADALKPHVDYQKAARLYIELALNYLKDGQVGRAKEKLMRAKKIAPEMPAVHYALGYYMESVGEVDQAKEFYKGAISLNPKGGIEHNNYGTFLCRQGEFYAAEKEFLIAVEDPEYTKTAEAYENAGLCVMQIPELAKAKEYFERAVRMDPRRSNALLELGILNYQEKKYARALEYHSLYNQNASSSARSLWLGVKLAEHFNESVKQAKYETMLKTRYPKSAEYQEILKHQS